MDDAATTLPRGFNSPTLRSPPLAPSRQHTEKTTAHHCAFRLVRRRRSRPQLAFAGIAPFVDERASFKTNFGDLHLAAGRASQSHLFPVGLLALLRRVAMRHSQEMRLLTDDDIEKSAASASEGADGAAAADAATADATAAAADAATADADTADAAERDEGAAAPPGSAVLVGARGCGNAWRVGRVVAEHGDGTHEVCIEAVSRGGGQSRSSRSSSADQEPPQVRTVSYRQLSAWRSGAAADEADMAAWHAKRDRVFVSGRAWDEEKTLREQRRGGFHWNGSDSDSDDDDDDDDDDERASWYAAKVTKVHTLEGVTYDVELEHHNHTLQGREVKRVEPSRLAARVAVAPPPRRAGRKLLALPPKRDALALVRMDEEERAAYDRIEVRAGFARGLVRSRYAPSTTDA